MKKLLLGIILVFILCTSVLSVPPPAPIIYKTRGNYYHLVPVGIKDGRVFGYPHMSDLFWEDLDGERHYFYPTRLSKGYLKDNRGLWTHSVFLNITYVDYANLETLPTPEDLFDMIYDADPFVEMYSCQGVCAHEIDKMNEIIERGALGQECTVRIKK